MSILYKIDLKNKFSSLISHWYLNIVLLILLQASCFSFAFATPYLTIEDDIVMSQMVKESTKPEELKLFLKLFPGSPYRKEIEYRLFRIEMRQLSTKSGNIFDPNTEEGLTWSVDQDLTSDDEITMSRMVGQSKSPKEIKLFLKIFPGSRFSDLMKQRKNSLEQDERVKDNTKSLQKVEAEVIKKAIKNQLTNPPKTTAKNTKKTKEQSPKENPPKQEKKKETPPPPEGDWAKIELGIPYALQLKETDGTNIETEANSQGIIIGWSSEIGLDIGMGGTIEYFTQKLDNDIGELRHLFFETQIKARLFSHINLGIGYGGGYTTIALEENPDNRDITPGEGTIKSMTIGTRLGSVGINYVVAEFTGAYRWRINSGVNSSNGKERWKGTLNMITVEFLY